METDFLDPYGDLTLEGLDVVAFGLPVLKKTETPPCGKGRACNRKRKLCEVIERLAEENEAFCAGFMHRSPMYLPGMTPVFSNAAIQILAVWMMLLEINSNRS